MIGHEPMAGQPSPVQGVLPLFDPLLGCPTTIVEMHYPFRASRHVRDDEAHPREQLSLAPFHPGHHSPRTFPTPGLIPKVVVSDHRLGRRPSHRPPEQRGDLPLQHLVAGESYSVKGLPLLEVLIDIRLGEGGIGPKVPAHSRPLVAGQDWLQYVPPPVRAMYVARTQHRALAVTELVEHEEWVIAHAPKVTVVRRSLLFPMYRTLRTVHIQDHSPVCRVRHCPVHPLSVQSIQTFHVAVLRKYLGLEPAHGVVACRFSFRTTSPSNDHTHRRVVRQPFSVVGILVARQTTVH